MLDAASPSCWREKELNEAPPNTDACSIAAAPTEIIS